MRFVGLLLALLAPLCSFAGMKDPLPSDRELRAFVDSFVTQNIEKYHVPGMVVSLVKGDRVVMLKGYGYADQERKIPMSATDTVVRVASTSKLFTAAGALQLKEQGRLDFDRNVNTILREFKLWNPFPKPVTMRHILTHTAGFDERFIGLVNLTHKDMLPLGEYLKNRMPRVVYPPGEAINYSNHGFALAGHIIELISGEGFSDYMDRHILKPLGMTSSSFEMPEHLRRRIAMGYELRGDKLDPEPLDFVSTGPASALVTTAEDISRFMVAMLNGGLYKGARILTPESVAAMQAQQFSLDKSLPGLGFAFMRHEMNDELMVVHGGEIRGFISYFIVFPKRKFGVFINYNRFGNDFGKLFWRELVQTFFPSGNTSDKQTMEGYWYDDSQESGPEEMAHTRMFRGFYRMIRHPHDGFTKIGAVLAGFASEYWVLSKDRGKEIRILNFPWLPNPRLTWDRVGPRHFKARETGERLVFRTNDSGNIDYMARQDLTEGTFERIPWYESLWVHSFIHILCFIVVIWQIEAMIRRKVLFTFTGLLVSLVGSLSLLFVGGLGVFFGTTKAVELVYGVPLFLQILLSLPLAAVILSLGIPLVAYFERRRVFRTFWSGARMVFEICSIYGVLAVFHYWNFVGFKYY